MSDCALAEATSRTPWLDRGALRLCSITRAGRRGLRVVLLQSA